MGQQITLSDSTFSRLKKYAEPLVDDIESVINKLADFRDSHETGAKTELSPKPRSAFLLKHDLKHTSVISAKIRNIQLRNPDWKSIYTHVIELAVERVGKDHISDYIIVNHEKGRKTDAGFHYIAAAGISVQGQKASDAWKLAAHICTALSIPIHVKFRWQPKDDASRPGEIEEMFINTK
jgi:hypothetical protein